MSARFGGANVRGTRQRKGSHPPLSSIKERVLADSYVFQSQASNLQSTVSSKSNRVNPPAAHHHPIQHVELVFISLFLSAVPSSHNEAHILTSSCLANGSSSKSNGSGSGKPDYRGSSNGATTKSSNQAGSFASLSNRTGLDRFVHEPAYVSAWSAVGAASSKK